MNAIADQIRATFNSLWAEDHDEPPPPLLNDTILLETGFDSMAFAVLVAQLDDDLGVDPFALDMDADPPITFADFVGFYERCIAATEGHVRGGVMLYGDGGASSKAATPVSPVSIHA
jgi:acyl carrier protein